MTLADASKSISQTANAFLFVQVACLSIFFRGASSKGDIQVTAQKQGKQVEIRVQDFGEGIPPEKLEHVFDRFYRGGDDSTIPGFGLGLPIAKTLVAGMDGEIKMESEVGKGSAVILYFKAE